MLSPPQVDVIARNCKIGFWVFGQFDKRIQVTDEVNDLLGLKHESISLMTDAEKINTYLNCFQKMQRKLIIRNAIDVIKGREEKQLIVSFKSTSGFKKRLFLSMVPSLKSGHLAGVEGTVQIANYLVDSEVDQLQENIDELDESLAEKNQKLDALNKELESFSYSVSHDLKAPLRAISGFSDILVKSDVGKEDRDFYLKRIKVNADNMKELIEEILLFSRSVKMKPVLSEVNLKVLLADVCETFEIDQRYNLQIGPLPVIKTDKMLFKQVIHNVLENAIKYSSKKEVPEIKVWSEANEDRFTIFIKDNGIGFDEKYKEKLFIPFERLHASSKFEGNGVGLSIVKRILDKLGGYIHVRSKLKQGSTVKIVIPNT